MRRHCSAKGANLAKESRPAALFAGLRRNGTAKGSGIVVDGVRSPRAKALQRRRLLICWSSKMVQLSNPQDRHRRHCTHQPEPTNWRRSTSASALRNLACSRGRSAGKSSKKSSHCKRRGFEVALRDITKKWKNPPITWKLAATQFAIRLGQRFPAVEV